MIPGDPGKGSGVRWEAGWSWEGRGGREKKLVFPQPRSSRTTAFNLMPAQKRRHQGWGGWRRGWGAQPTLILLFPTRAVIRWKDSVGVIQEHQGLRERGAEGSGSLSSWKGEEGGRTCAGAKWGGDPAKAGGDTQEPIRCQQHRPRAGRLAVWGGFTATKLSMSSSPSAR